MRTNADADGEVLKETTALCVEGKALLTKGAERFGLRARGYHRILRVARTISDLDDSPCIAPAHVAEALSFRLSSFETA